MNEWSPGENFSRPGTPNQIARSIRNLKEEPVKLTKPFVTRPVNNCQSKPSFQQLSMEDVSSTTLTSSNNKKLSITGMSDPRFKRVLQPGMQNDASVGTEIKSAKPSLVSQEKTYTKFKHRTINTPESNKTLVRGDSAQDQQTLDIVSLNQTSESENLTASVIYDHSKDHLKQLDKLKFKHHMTDKSFSKESLSDCTINTGNTSLISEDIVDEYSNDVSVFPSSVRVKKVQNWIQDQKIKPDKKQSVVTVIGQTQGQETLSSALREIDERRKLVKELDKYAVCSKIIESDKEKDLVSKIGYLTSSGKDICNDVMPCKNEVSNKLISSKVSVKDDSVNNKSSNNNRESILGNKNECIESASPKFETRKRLHAKKKTKKYSLTNEYPVKGRIRELFSHYEYQKIILLLVVLSGTLGCLMFFLSQTAFYVSFDIFSHKPKPMTWYEKVCQWIWEIFRPTGNYHRTGPWHSF